MSGSYLESLAALAVGAARVWQPRLPARFEVQDVWADDGWDIEEDWTPAPRAVVVEPALPPRLDAGPPTLPRTPPAVPAPPPALSIEGPGAARPTVAATPEPDQWPELQPRPSAEPTAEGPPRRREPAPSLHVTVRELAEPATEEDEPAAPAPPSAPSPAGLFTRPVTRRPAPPAEPEAEAERAVTAPTPGPPLPARPGRPETHDTGPRRPPARPTVHVHIDRVDVRAVLPAPPPAPAAPVPELRPAPDLERYLRGGGAP